MKRLISKKKCTLIALTLLSLSYANASNYSDNENSMEPEIIAQISRSAIDKSLSPNGLKAILGIYFGPQKFENMITTESKEFNQKTSKKMSIFAASVGIEYAQSFRNNLFMAVGLLVELGQKQRQSGGWNTINEAFDKKMSTAQYPGERKAQLYTEFFTPSIGLKLGYRFRKWRSTLYFKFALSRLAGLYKYYLGDKEFCRIKANSMALSGYLGGEYRISKKFGLGLEIGAPLQRKEHKKGINGVEHLTKMSRVEFRALVYYTVAGVNSDLSAEYTKR